jgi:hypothetical protein
VPPPEVDVAPLGETPPPVGPVAPPLEPEPVAPEPVEPDPVEPDPVEPDPLPALEDPPPVPEDADGVPELAPDEAAAEDEPPVEAPELVVVEVEVVLALVVAVVGGAAIVAVGTVSGGAPEVSVVAEPPPQAPRPAQTARPAATAAIRRSGPSGTAGGRVTTAASDVERLHAPTTVGAVVEVPLAVLIAPVAEAQVLDRPRQL